MNGSLPKVLLIGGTSNVGKTTLAQALAERLGARCVSTDYLARHPGRPWVSNKPHVIEHYTTLGLEALITDVLRHYKSLLPQIQTMITEHASSDETKPLILEGSALWPEWIAPLTGKRVKAVWLTASDPFLTERILKASELESAPEPLKSAIEMFLRRTLRYNALMLGAVKQLHLNVIDVDDFPSLEGLSERAMASLHEAEGSI